MTTEGEVISDFVADDSVEIPEPVPEPVPEGELKAVPEGLKEPETKDKTETERLERSETEDTREWLRVLAKVIFKSSLFERNKKYIPKVERSFFRRLTEDLKDIDVEERSKTFNEVVWIPFVSAFKEVNGKTRLERYKQFSDLFEKDELDAKKNADLKIQPLKYQMIPIVLKLIPILGVKTFLEISRFQNGKRTFGTGWKVVAERFFGWFQKNEFSPENPDCLFNPLNAIPNFVRNAWTQENDYDILKDCAFCMIDSFPSNVYSENVLFQIKNFIVKNSKCGLSEFEIRNIFEFNFPFLHPEDFAMFLKTEYDKDIAQRYIKNYYGETLGKDMSNFDAFFEIALRTNNQGRKPTENPKFDTYFRNIRESDTDQQIEINVEDILKTVPSEAGTKPLEIVLAHPSGEPSEGEPEKPSESPEKPSEGEHEIKTETEKPSESLEKPPETEEPEGDEEEKTETTEKRIRKINELKKFVISKPFIPFDRISGILMNETKYVFVDADNYDSSLMFPVPFISDLNVEEIGRMQSFRGYQGFFHDNSFIFKVIYLLLTNTEFASEWDSKSDEFTKHSLKNQKMRSTVPEILWNINRTIRARNNNEPIFIDPDDPFSEEITNVGQLEEIYTSNIQNFRRSLLHGPEMKAELERIEERLKDISFFQNKIDHLQLNSAEFIRTFNNYRQRMLNKEIHLTKSIPKPVSDRTEFLKIPIDQQYVPSYERFRNFMNEESTITFSIPMIEDCLNIFLLKLPEDDLILKGDFEIEQELMGNIAYSRIFIPKRENIKSWYYPFLVKLLVDSDRNFLTYSDIYRFFDSVEIYESCNEFFNADNKDLSCLTCIVVGRRLNNSKGYVYQIVPKIFFNEFIRETRDDYKLNELPIVPFGIIRWIFHSEYPSEKTEKTEKKKQEVKKQEEDPKRMIFTDTIHLSQSETEPSEGKLEKITFVMDVATDIFPEQSFYHFEEIIEKESKLSRASFNRIVDGLKEEKVDVAKLTRVHGNTFANFYQSLYGHAVVDNKNKMIPATTATSIFPILKILKLSVDIQNHFETETMFSETTNFSVINNILNSESDYYKNLYQFTETAHYFNLPEERQKEIITTLATASFADSFGTISISDCSDFNLFNSCEFLKRSIGLDPQKHSIVSNLSKLFVKNFSSVYFRTQKTNLFEVAKAFSNFTDGKLFFEENYVFIVCCVFRKFIFAKWNDPQPSGLHFDASDIVTMNIPKITDVITDDVILEFLNKSDSEKDSRILPKHAIPGNLKFYILGMIEKAMRMNNNQKENNTILRLVHEIMIKDSGKSIEFVEIPALTFPESPSGSSGTGTSSSSEETEHGWKNDTTSPEDLKKVLNIRLEPEIHKAATQILTEDEKGRRKGSIKFWERFYLLSKFSKVETSIGGRRIYTTFIRDRITRQFFYDFNKPELIPKELIDTGRDQLNLSLEAGTMIVYRILNTFRKTLEMLSVKEEELEFLPFIFDDEAIQIEHHKLFMSLLWTISVML